MFIYDHAFFDPSISRLLPLYSIYCCFVTISLNINTLPNFTFCLRCLSHPLIFIYSCTYVYIDIYCVRTLLYSAFGVHIVNAADCWAMLIYPINGKCLQIAIVVAVACRTHQLHWKPELFLIPLWVCFENCFWISQHTLKRKH